MKLAFIDIARAYGADAPDLDQPLGGTNSAVCFLSRELVRAGVSCTLFNKVREERVFEGVVALPLERLAEACTDPSYSAFVFCGRWVEWMVNLVRENTQAPLIAWMHESLFGSELVRALPGFQAAVYVSEWQMGINRPLAQGHWHQVVLRNAMNPKASHMFDRSRPIMAFKEVPPVLLYAGATPRGAFHVPPMLDHLRPLQGEFSVEIYCDVSPSQDPQANEQYITWMRALPNVRHVGMVGQSQLLDRMKRAAILISPNTWPETSCIALIEAMAAGLSVVTTNRAALPETASGFARHVEVPDPDEPLGFDMPLPYAEFAQEVSSAMDQWVKDPLGTESKLKQQIAYFQDHYQWHQRVDAWIRFIRSLAA